MDNQTLSTLVGLIYDAAFDVDLWPSVARILSAELEPLLEEPQNTYTVPPADPPPGETGDGFSNRPESLQSHFNQAEPLITAPEYHQGHRSSSSELIGLLHSHVIRALQLKRQIIETRQERNDMQGLLETLPLGILITDSKGRVLSCNHKLNQIISERKGLLIKHNQLCAMSSANTLQLRKKIRRIAESKDTKGDTIHLYDPEITLSAFMVPFGPNSSTNSGDKNRVLVLVATPEMHTEISPEILMSLYQLSGAEAKLVSALIKDRSLNAIAEEFGLSRHTVRNQLKAVFEKTGTNRQAELIRQIITGPAMLASLNSNIQAIPDKNLTPGRFVYPEPPGSRRHQIMWLPDGRRLGYAEYGHPSGRPVMLMHSISGSRLERHPDETLIERLGIRLIIPDRPGGGLSDNRPRLTLFNWAQDVAWLADHLGFHRFNIIGHSLGSMFTLACAFKLRERIGRIVTVGGIAPFSHIGELDGMHIVLRITLSLGKYAHTLLEPLIELFHFNISSEQSEKMLFQNLPPLDRVLIGNPAIKEAISENMMEHLRRGERSILQDVFIASRDWGFELKELTLPAVVWHGEQDPIIPIQMARKLVEKLPNSRPRFLPKVGHLIMFHAWREILLSAIHND